MIKWNDLEPCEESGIGKVSKHWFHSNKWYNDIFKPVFKPFEALYY